MTSFRLALATLWIRLRWEILGFVLLVLAGNLIDVFSPESQSGGSSIAVIAFWWLTFRIVMSETGYRTHGGWKTRPFMANSILFARISILLTLALGVILVRSFTLRHLFHPDTEQWVDHMRTATNTTVVPWLIFVAFLGALSAACRLSPKGRVRNVAGSAIAVAAIYAAGTSLDKNPYRTQGRQFQPNRLNPGIQLALPGAKQFVGPWGSNGDEDWSPGVKLMARIPIAGWEVNPIPGVRLIELKYSAAENTVRVSLQMLVMDDNVMEKLVRMVPVLAYADGSYGAVVSFDSDGNSYRAARRELPNLAHQITFASPLSRPVNREADPAWFSPTEILFFSEDTDLPSIPSAAGPGMEEEVAKLLTSTPDPADVPGFVNAVTSIIDSLSVRNELNRHQRALIDDLPPEAIDPILAYHPWSDRAWKEMVRPILMEHASYVHKPTLLARLATDERLGSVCIEKGWSADAIPVLRQRAIKHLPLDAESIVLLANQNDSQLAPHLGAVAQRLWGIEKLAPILRESAGFDWESFVATGWKHHKYLNYDRQGWHYATWAAELGDDSAFRRLAEEGAKGKKWEAAQLARLVAGEHQDLIGFLKENIDRLEFDPVTRQWR